MVTRRPARRLWSAGAAAPPDAAGWLLGRLSVLPALLAMAWLLAGLPLLLVGRFTPVLMLVVSVPLAVLLIYLGLRWVPGRWQSALPAPGPRRARTPWWAVAGVIAVAAAFGAHQLIYHSQQIIVERDPASYMQFAYWIAHHGSLPIPQARAAFGGTHQLLHFDSLAFYQVGGNVVPQFMAGLPMVVAAGFWAGGVGAAVLVPPLLGACAVLTFGGLAARLTGPRWAPLAALVLALSLPEQFTSRSAYSEPLAQILFLGGLCLVIDSLAAEGRAARVLAALGGLALGLTLVVRIDGASDILPVIPYCGILLLSRRRQAVPLLIGLAAGALYGAVDGLVLSRPYLATISSSLNPLVAAFAVVAVVTAVVVVVRWRRGLPEIRSDWLPNAAAALAVLILIGLAVRPYLQPVRHRSAIQAAAHVRVNPPSVFWAMSLDWVFWYIGVPSRAAGHARGRAAGPALPAGPGAGLDAAADGVRVDHRHRPGPAGDRPQPAVGEPQARPRRAARPHPAGGLGGGLAGRLAPPARLRPGDPGRPGDGLLGGAGAPGRRDLVRPRGRHRRAARGPAGRARPGAQANLRR